MDEIKRGKLNGLLSEFRNNEMVANSFFIRMSKNDFQRDEAAARLFNMRRWIATLEDVVSE
jgi:hypothetical protein